MILRRDLVILFSAVMVISLLSTISFAEAKLPENLPDVSKAPQKVRIIETENIKAYARTLYTTLDDPDNHESGSLFDGVASLSLPSSDGFTYNCTGTLLPTGKHILTAAHCVTDSNGVVNLLSGGTATFQGTFGTETIGIAGVTVHSSFDGDFIKGNDIAILELSSIASSGITRYDYAKNDNFVGQVLQKIGYGLSGKLKTGEDRSNYPYGTKRDGQNRYDAFADVMYQGLRLQPNTHYVPEAIYQYDSDDGKTNHDAFDFFFNIPDLGLGNNEVISSNGDSGGPTLSDDNNDGIPDTVVGITSYGITLEFTNGPSSDCTTRFGSPFLDSSCGEFAGDTRVSYYSGFIENVLDSDGDGIFNDDDNCVNTSNPGQEDNDLDGIGNDCDALPSEANIQCEDKTGNWNAASTWFPQDVPSDFDRLVVINCILTVLSGNTVTIGNILDIDSSSIINLDGDMLIASQVNLVGTLNVNSNTLEISGTYNVQSGGTHNNNVNGLTKVKNSATMTVDSGGTVNNIGKHVTQTGGTSTVSGTWNEQASSPNDVFGTFSVENNGNYNNQAGSSTRVGTGGSFNVKNGGTLADQGSFITLAGQTTTVSGTWFEQSSASNTVAGIFSISSGGVYTSNANGLTKITSGGTFQVQSGGEENNAGKHVTQTGGTTSIEGTENNSGEYVTQTGASTTLTGEWNEQSNTNTIFGTYTVQSGGIYDNEADGTTRVGSGGAFNIDSDGTVNNIGDFFTRSGATTTLTGLWNELSGNTNTISGTFNVASGGVYDNEANGRTKVTNGANFNLQNGGKVNNNGFYIIQTGGTVTLDDDYDNNSGSKTYNFGTMNLDCNGIFNDLGLFSGTPIANICPP